MDRFDRRQAQVNRGDDVGDEIFAPLSNLPTPPLTSASKSADGESPFGVDPKIMAPASYLSSLVPPGAARHPPSPSLIATYVSRARLPSSTVALAACILDSLSSFFVRTWRKELSALGQPAMTPPTAGESQATPPPSSPSSAATTPAVCRRYSSWFSVSTASPSPDLIVLAALQIASSFLDDARVATRWWTRNVAGGGVSARQMDATVRCVLRDIDYDLLAFTPSVVERMRRIIMRSGMKVKEDEEGDEENVQVKREGSDGSVVTCGGICTPGPSPL